MENQKSVSNKQGAALRLLWGFPSGRPFWCQPWGVDYRAVSGWPRVKPSRGLLCIPGAMLRVKHQPARLSVLLHTPVWGPSRVGCHAAHHPLCHADHLSHYRASSFILTSTQTNGGFERGLPIQQLFNELVNSIFNFSFTWTPPDRPWPVKECSPWQHYGFSSSVPSQTSLCSRNSLPVVSFFNFYLHLFLWNFRP